MEQLVDLLHAEGLPTENLVKALSSVLELLKSPKRTTEVIDLGAAAFCLENVASDKDSRVRALSADVLAAMCNLVPGRRSLKKCDLGPLVSCLGEGVDEAVRSSAAKAVETFSNYRDGASFLAEQDFVSEIVASGLSMGGGGDSGFPDAVGRERGRSRRARARDSPDIYLSILSICLSVYLSVCLSICLSIYLFRPICLSLSTPPPPPPPPHPTPRSARRPSSPPQQRSPISPNTRTVCGAPLKARQ